MAASISSERDIVAGDEVKPVGQRCTRCGYPTTSEYVVCPRCRGSLRPAKFSQTGVVWASTVVRIPLADWPEPQVLAYVDVDDGPRMLMAIRGGDGTAPRAGSRIRVVALEARRTIATVVL